MTMTMNKILQARIQKFFKGGGGVEGEKFERKIFFDTIKHVKTKCTNKN